MSDVAFDETICRNIAVDVRYVLFVIDRIGGRDTCSAKWISAAANRSGSRKKHYI